METNSQGGHASSANRGRAGGMGGTHSFWSSSISSLFWHLVVGWAMLNCDGKKKINTNQGSNKHTRIPAALGHPSIRGVDKEGRRRGLPSWWRAPRGLGLWARGAAGGMDGRALYRPRQLRRKSRARPNHTYLLGRRIAFILRFGSQSTTGKHNKPPINNYGSTKQ